MGGLCQQPYRAGIQGKSAVPLRHRQVHQPARPRRTGVADQHVQVARRALSLGHDVGTLLRHGQVTHYTAGLGTLGAQVI